MSPTRGSRPLFGGVEAGGTKFVCAVGRGPDDVAAELRVPTTDPEETLGRTVDFFRGQASRGRPVAALGIASFGPADVDPASAEWGSIRETPKPGWSGTPIAARLGEALEVPVGFDTDVNAAAAAELRWGAGRPESTGGAPADPLVYWTVGTGIGGGAVVNGRRLHGLMHPEMGHLRVPHDRERDPFEGCCSFHGDCLEGLASGPAIRGRWGRPAEELPADHPAWELEAGYLAHAALACGLMLSPRRVVLGGGVMRRSELFPMIRARFRELLGSYPPATLLRSARLPWIVPAGLGSRSGMLGALLLAREAHASA